MAQRALEVALALSMAFGGEVEAVSVYDPFYHNQVFQKLVDVLSEESGQLFHLKEQEKLHQGVIDRGMSSLCQENLAWARKKGQEAGIEVKARTMEGKPAPVIAEYARERKPALLIAERYGAHRMEGLDIGSNADNLLRLSPSNMLIAANK